MHPNALLALCAELLHTVASAQAPADGSVSQFFRAHSKLGARERHCLAETTYQFLRQRLWCQHAARQASSAATTPQAIARRWAALAWQGDRAFLDAALDDSERAWLAKVQAQPVAERAEKLRHNLPDWLAAGLREELGDESQFWAFVEAMSAPAGLDLRVNTLKAKRDEVRAELAQSGIQSEGTPHSPWGLRLTDKPALQRHAAFTQGRIEVQDEGSQLLVLLLGAGRGQMVVDFCAGAGGKTLALGAAMRNTGRLYAFDTSAHRLQALKPRLVRSGLQNVYVSQIAHERDDRVKRLQGKVDRVLIDAPCSGLGTLRRNPDLKWRQSPATLESLRSTQANILCAASRLLKPGGELVYATCSLLRSENEAQAEAFEAAQGGAFERLDAAARLAAAGVTHAQELVEDGFLRLWPQRHGCDGFFGAIWSKK
jgi:16S rRNA (cytosine967-C5)-methyltransferase